VRESRPISAAKETLSSDQQKEMSGNIFACILPLDALHAGAV